MSKRIVDEGHAREALKEMIEDKKSDVPVEEVLTIFCERYGLTMDECRSFYEELVKNGEIKKRIT